MTLAPEAAPIAAAAGPHIPDLLTRIELRLGEIASAYPEPLSGWAAGTIAAGGKRLRPLLVLVAAGPPGQWRDGPAEGLVRAGVAVELVHSATLVHDDVLDAAALRRGRPTVWAAAGRQAAIATGDALFADAFAELVRSGDAEQVRALSRAGSALAEGELLQRADAWNTAVSVERYLHRCELKTARLFEAACALGVLEATGDQALAARLTEFGRRIGLAFQLLDDVLDVSGPAERTGKHRGTDLLDGTVTLPLLLARERDPSLATLDLRTVTTPTQAEALCDAIAACGALDAARTQALELVAGAKAELPDGLPAGQRTALDLVADGVVARYA
ncbi:MAG: polyprenyl synthetase family protein [Solirubrobacterales bacterium]|nr:polyprenyl synthetase family protein [Solirubrobacterales bacterium]